MSMYFTTLKTSETGKKFQEIERKRLECYNAQKELAKKYGFSAWREGYWVVWGGMSSCADFEQTPDSKIWGKGADDGEYFPKRNSKVGKEIHREIELLPTVRVEELNECVGFKYNGFRHIGFSSNNESFFGFSVNESWGFVPPKDCEEVTYTEYKRLFEINN